MKNILYFLFVLFISHAALSQTVSEKLIVKLSPDDISSGYDVKYDKNSGGYVYQKYDTATKKAYLITPKGKSGVYDGVNTYNAWFDKDGNVYCAAYNTMFDTVYTYYLLKNSDVIGTYDYINDSWTEKNGSLYFAVKENGKTSLAALDLSTGTITKGKLYDDIIFVYYPETVQEGEPVGYPGFTTDGKPYYIATNNNKKFVVIGDQEQKAYADIDTYNFTLDKTGQPVYIANDMGNLYDDQNMASTFVVQGTNEYKKFDYVYGPVLFDNSNNPIYTSGDKSENTSIYPQQLMAGNNELSKKYTAGISFQQFTPSGRLAYVGSNYIDSTHSESYLVVDGKEGKKYEGIANLVFQQGDIPVFTATVGKKQIVVKSDSKISDSYPGIVDFKLLPGGKLYYTSAVWGDYSKGKSDKYTIHMGDDDFGPYEIITAGDSGSYVQIDNAGNWGYIAGKLVDKKNYVYEYTAYSNIDNSDRFDNIDNLKLIRGKVFFAGYKTIDRKNYTQKVKLYVDMKPVTGDYDVLTPANNGASVPGVMAFTGSKGSDIYYVEIKY